MRWKYFGVCFKHKKTLFCTVGSLHIAFSHYLHQHCGIFCLLWLLLSFPRHVLRPLVSFFFFSLSRVDTKGTVKGPVHLDTTYLFGGVFNHSTPSSCIVKASLFVVVVITLCFRAQETTRTKDVIHFLYRIHLHLYALTLFSLEEEKWHSWVSLMEEVCRKESVMFQGWDIRLFWS